MKISEKEKVYLLKRLPTGIKKCKRIFIRAGNFFNPNQADSLRIRQKGNHFELIKKEGNSSKSRIEHIINIKKQEFNILWNTADFKYEKIRYFYPIKGLTAEIDIYLGRLKGYARVEVEFKNWRQLDKFKPPFWFGPEITQWNHKIHKDIGKISFSVLKARYSKIGIKLDTIS